MKERLDVLLVKKSGGIRESESSDHVRKCIRRRTEEDKAGTTFPDEVTDRDQRTYTSICQQRRIKAGKSACQF